MKIQIASDIHLEFPQNRKWLSENPLIPQADLLILAGDTVPYVYSNWAAEFYETINKDFQLVFSIFGNHEFYRGEINTAFPAYYKKINDNITQFNNTSILYNDVRFIFTSLWTDVPLRQRSEVQEMMNDYRLIQKRTIFKELVNIQVEDMVNYHQQSLEFLQSELELHYHEKTVVVTHHVPVYESLPEVYMKSALQYCYGNNLNDLILANPQICLWICGHCHKTDQRKIGDTVIVRNPLGYVSKNQQLDFNREKIIEI
ncbi:MAG: metallophosphoesterase [Candidatus Cloacimonetes bacterium]|nr:metallophosphoesterase [Candidatus Cloacimonadota bacterium]